MVEFATASFLIFCECIKFKNRNFYNLSLYDSTIVLVILGISKFLYKSPLIIFVQGATPFRYWGLNLMTLTLLIMAFSAFKVIIVERR